jgi:hypothetical protein
MESFSPLKSHLDRTQSIECGSPTLKKTSDFSTEARTTMLHRLKEYIKSNFKLDAAEKEKYLSLIKDMGAFVSY